MSGRGKALSQGLRMASALVAAHRAFMLARAPLLQRNCPAPRRPATSPQKSQRNMHRRGNRVVIHLRCLKCLIIFDARQLAAPSAKNARVHRVSGPCRVWHQKHAEDLQPPTTNGAQSDSGRAAAADAVNRRSVNGKRWRNSGELGRRATTPANGEAARVRGLSA